jgi:hypothetical protein
VLERSVLIIRGSLVRLLNNKYAFVRPALCPPTICTGSLIEGADDDIMIKPSTQRSGVSTFSFVYYNCISELY